MVDGGRVAFESGIASEVQLDLAHRGHPHRPSSEGTEEVPG
jgi:hypothetical protein